MTTQARAEARLLDEAPEERAARARNRRYLREHRADIFDAAPSGHRLIVIYDGGKVRSFDDARAHWAFLDSLDPFVRATAVLRLKPSPARDWLSPSALLLP